jgi:hypothetical protein
MRRPFRERVVAQARPDAAAHDLVGMTIGETANRPGRATVVLVHGGFLGGWICEDVAASGRSTLLRKRLLPAPERQRTSWRCSSDGRRRRCSRVTLLTVETVWLTRILEGIAASWVPL